MRKKKWFLGKYIPLGGIKSKGWKTGEGNQREGNKKKGKGKKKGRKGKREEKLVETEFWPNDFGEVNQRL